MTCNFNVRDDMSDCEITIDGEKAFHRLITRPLFGLTTSGCQHWKPSNLLRPTSVCSGVSVLSIPYLSPIKDMQIAEFPRHDTLNSINKYLIEV